MDTSKEYIKMCEKTEEIQRERQWQEDQWKEGDCFTTSTGIIGFHCEGCAIEYGQRDDNIWLPRQDQLQEMVHILTPTDLNYLVSKDNLFDGDFCGGRWIDAYYLKFTSLEQLWLAFVMKEKYNKIWNGEIWTPTPPNSRA